MAYYEHLPIFKKAMDLALYLEEIVKNFSRYHKYTLGQDLRDLSRKILMQIIRVNSEYDKKQHLKELVILCDMQKTMLVFCKEAKAFNNFNSFQHSISMAVLLCRQSEGWLKSTKK
ncbi:MAG: four helix bundle protein [Desulforegulaceae bacterium]|jgi:hypothetical protein|nr:four helix bundle protein [Desulforegulaceae bacterium]